MNNESKNIDIELKDDSGQVEAVFSLFNSLDSDGDVVVPGAVKSGFKNNQVPMVWSHKWDMPIGKGTIAQDDDKAVFKGEFFMDTESGKEAYNLVKNMGDMQQWSFGYKVNDSEYAKADDNSTNARYLKDLTVYEVSPVLVGANQDTYTLAIKSNTELLKEITEQKSEVQEEESTSCACCSDKKSYEDEEQEMKSCKYHEGGPCVKMEEDKKEMKSEEDLEISEGSKPFSDEVKDVLAALDDLVARAKAIAMLRDEDGRKLGVKATEALRSVADDLNDAWTEIDEFIGTVGTEGALELEIEEELVEDELAESEEVAEASTDTIDVETEVEEVTEEEAPAEESVDAEPEDEVAEEETPEDNTDSSDDEEFDAEWARAQQIIAESLVEEIEEV
jgi:HK97 family phage prohead protease